MRRHRRRAPARARDVHRSGIVTSSEGIQAAVSCTPAWPAATAAGHPEVGAVDPHLFRPAHLVDDFGGCAIHGDLHVGVDLREILRDFWKRLARAYGGRRGPQVPRTRDQQLAGPRRFRRRDGPWDRRVPACRTPTQANTSSPFPFASIGRILNGREGRREVRTRFRWPGQASQCTTRSELSGAPWLGAGDLRVSLHPDARTWAGTPASRWPRQVKGARYRPSLPAVVRRASLFAVHR